MSLIILFVIASIIIALISELAMWVLAHYMAWCMREMALTSPKKLGWNEKLNMEKDENGKSN